jgi:hypothetical protein
MRDYDGAHLGSLGWLLHLLLGALWRHDCSVGVGVSIDDWIEVESLVCEEQWQC